MSDDRKISERYRELPREEPPRQVDDAILSAARRAVESRPAPLVVPTGRRRWYFPVAAAAVIVLAVAVTMHVEREQPDAEVASGQLFKADPAPAEQAKREEAATEKPQPAAPPAPKAAPPPQVFVPDPKPRPVPEQPASASPPQEERRAMMEQPPATAADQRARDFARLDSERLAHERQRRAQERAAAEMARAEAERSQQMRRQSSGVAASRPAPETAVLAKLAQQSPEQWLQGIDDLKRQGRHDEAEKQLAEFRKRYPNYKIPEAITEKFEKR